ncbi:MAG: TIR domain-containing protein [Thermoguttaceae bacterium]|nr:TIR domain-containing protein [Thermoguttaceae bacterium]
MEKAAKPLNIFISYGHEFDSLDDNGKPYPDPNNESVVRKIKAYLESRGHEVWLDREKIQTGADWRRAIYEGVEWSDVALICLSRRAMRPNGVCRDEISIALGVRGGNMFPVQLEDTEYPAYLLNRQLFTNFMDWRAHWTEDSVDETWLDQNLEELAKSLEKENVWRYGVEMVELKKLLKPWNMNSRLRSLDRNSQYIFNQETQEFEKKTVHKFCGRESLFKMFEGKIKQSGKAVRIESERVLWLKKGPGFGKSRFAAELLYRYYYAISAAYFIEYNQSATHKPQTFVTSVAYQLAQANSSYREKLLNYLNENQDEINLQTGDPQTLFKTLVVDLLSDDIDGGRATQWILVDALDEATENNRNEIAELISQNLDNLPPWICFFITSRDQDVVLNGTFSEYEPIQFDDNENVNDIQGYIRSELTEMNLPFSEEMVVILQEKSEGTFLYPEMVFRDLKKNSFTLDDIRDLPNGVIRYIRSQFDRHFKDDVNAYKQNIRPMLGYILTSCEPIPRTVLKYCLGMSRDSELDDRLEQLGTFFLQSGLTDEDTVVPFHKSVIDYCFDRNSSGNYCIYPEEANKDFANRGLELYKTGGLQWTTRTDEAPDIVQRYFLNWLPSHLINANMKEEAADVLSDFAFLMKRFRFGNVERVILDYILFRGKLERISTDSDAYFDVVSSNAHFLRRNCEETPAYKTMLQIATEVADKCPVTQAAERWLNPESGESPCNWFWLNKVNRPKEYQSNPCKLVIENTGNKALILSNGDALSWGTDDHNLCIWDLKTGVCKAVLEGHKDAVWGAIGLSSDDILSWSRDSTLRLWTPDGTCKAVLEGHTSWVEGAIELRSGDLLSWSWDETLRLWSPDGKCIAVLEGHTSWVEGAIELRSGDILSWSWGDKSLRLWSPDGKCIAVLEGHTSWVEGAIELRSGDILSWSRDNTLRLWTPDGTCKAILEGHTKRVRGAIELSSDDILSWSWDHTLRLWSPDGTCKAVLEGHKDAVWGAIGLSSGDILSWSEDHTLRLWSQDGRCKAVMEGHTDRVWGAIELRSGDILSWSNDNTLRLWSPDGTCKAVLEGHTSWVIGALELRSGDILSWSEDHTLRLWSQDGRCKAVMEGHTERVYGAIELRSGDILSWSYDNTLRLWSPDGKCKAVLKGHTWIIKGALELSSGDILSWSWDSTLHLWSPDGTCKTVLEGHTSSVDGAIELRSGDILSWGYGTTLCLWSPDGTCKAVLEGHTSSVYGAIELRSGNILSWCGGYECKDNDLRLWSLDGACKAVLKGHTKSVDGAIELRSGDILSWSDDHTLRLWSPDGTCKAVLEGHTWIIKGALELRSGDILSWSDDNTLRLWSSDGTCKEVIDSKNPQFDSYYSLFHKKRVHEQYYAKITDWGIELQHNFKPIARWNSVKCDSRFVGAGRICVWYGRFVEFLQLNYGNRMSITFEQAHQFLNGEIDESQLVTYDP